MSRIVKFAKVLRRNWKKSTFFFGVLAYGASYGIEKYKTFEMMRAYCEEAKTYGEKPLPQMTKPKHVTVILNPQANNGKANVRFEKFAAPLLHLAGLKISVFQTEKEKQAQDLMEIMSNTDAVIVAGGNGTVHEVITGLMRRPDIEEVKLPLGIIPLGKTNTVAKHLFGSNVSSEAQLMAEAAMAVIRETTVALDVMKIQYASEEKPVYAMCSFEQGVFADVEPKVGKYWYLGFLKDKFAYFKNSFKERKPIQNIKLEYVAPCSGCSQCYVPPKIKKKLNENRWWSAFLPRNPHSQISDSTPDYSSIINEDCGKHLELKPSYSNITVSTAAVNETRKDIGGSLCIKVYPISLSTKEFISYGLRYHRSKLSDDSISTIVKARELIIESTDETDSEDAVNVEKGSEHTDEFYYIDNEKYKRASCSISLLPKQVTLYG